MRITTISEAVEPVDYTAILQEIADLLTVIAQKADDVKMGIAYLFALMLVGGVFITLYKFSRSLFSDI